MDFDRKSPDTEEGKKTAEAARNTAAESSVRRVPADDEDFWNLPPIHKRTYSPPTYDGRTTDTVPVSAEDTGMPKTETIVSKVEGNASDGDIILFHDLEDARFSTPKALRIIIPYLIENGYEIVTVSELLREGA